MRFQPGEPAKHSKALSQCEFQSQTILAYCSGNNLIIFAENQLIHTFYLPKDALSVDINNKTGAICVLLTDSVLVYDYTKSFTRGDSWKLSASLPAVAEDCRWIDTFLLLVGTDLRLVSTTGEIFWEKRVGSPKQAVVCDSQKFVLIEGNSRRISVWSRVSQSAYGFDFDFINLPSDIRWCKWSSSGLLFVWGADCVLRGFNNVQLVVSIQLPLVAPVLLGDLILYAYKSKFTVIRLKNQGDLIVPTYLWSDVPIEFDSIHKKFNFYDSIEVVATQRDMISLTAHKQDELLTASIPLITPESVAPANVQITFTGIYTGHIKSIKRICRSSLGDSLFTQTRFTENIVWKSYKLPNGETTLDKKCTVNVNNPDCADLWESSLVTVADDRLILWDISVPVAVHMASVQLEETPMLVSCLTYSSILHVIAVYPENISMWKVKGSELIALKDSNLITGDDAVVIEASMVDPVGWTKPNDREVLTTVTKEFIQTWSLVIRASQPVWTESSRLKLSEHLVAPKNILMKMSSKKKLAVAQNNRLFIWDAVNDVIEFDKTAENPINDLDWTTTPTGECLLGVGYSKRVVVYCQQRYDYTTKLEAWIPIRVLNIEDYTEHDIGDSIWLKDATFVIGAGNQLYIQDAQVNFEDERVRSLLRERNTIPEQRATLFDINAVLSGPLPVYHPQFLIQLIFSNRADLACEILCLLAHQIKYAPIEPNMVVLDYWLGLDLGTMRIEGSHQFNSTVASGLEEQLKNKALAYLTRHQQMTLLSVIQSLASIQNQSLDSNGTKFMLGYQLYRLHQKTQNGMNMRDFVWGSISSSKQVLLDEVLSAGATSNLASFSAYGLMFWLENNVLVEQTEQLAKHIFAKTRDPVQVSLLYLAMRKKTLLMGLWRVSSSHPEQQKTMKLLNNDFETDRWKSAALKNAYALMSKHRYEYAAALFLLGGACKDAVNVLARQLKNLPLAFMVARVYEGDDGESIKYIIERFLSGGDQNSVEGDDIYSHKHWLKVWAYMTTGDLKNAVVSATVIRSTSAKRSIIDPVLLWIYNELRAKFALNCCEETKVLERTSSIYCRMGCDLIALMASGEWKFDRAPSGAITPAPSTPRENSEMPTDSTTRESTPNISDTSIQPAAAAPQAAAPQAAQFDLSAFGF